jgi:hypothetical protein
LETPYTLEKNLGEVFYIPDPGVTQNLAVVVIDKPVEKGVEIHAKRDNNDNENREKRHSRCRLVQLLIALLHFHGFF